VPPDALAVTPIGGATPAPVRRADGIRVVSRENKDGRYFDLMPSTLSWYLLPPLADCSLVRREARSAAGCLRFTGAEVELEEIGAIVSPEMWHALVTGVAAGVDIGAIAQVTLELFNRLGSLRSRTLTETLTTFPAATSEAPRSTARSAAEIHTETETRAGTADGRPAADAPVSDLASRISALSGLSDELLAELFRVERETFCRWRSGALANPRVGNRRRLGLLLALLEELASRQVSIRDWLLNSVTPHGLTPYELLDQGRIDDVAFLAASVAEPHPIERDARVASREEPEDLQFGDDDVWELAPLDDDEQ
jgi:hypothetical protein